LLSGLYPYGLFLGGFGGAVFEVEGSQYLCPSQVCRVVLQQGLARYHSQVKGCLLKLALLHLFPSAYLTTYGMWPF